MDRYDTVIIGAGPAGLEAALNLQVRAKRFRLFSANGVSAKVAAAPRIDNYLGLPAISGAELAERFAAHLSAAGIELTPEKVSAVYPMGGYFAIATASQMLEAVAVILCTGVHASEPIPGEETFLGRGVGYCATCDAPLYRGKTVIIVGHSHDAADEANFVAELASEVIFVPGKAGVGGLAGSIRVAEGAPLEIKGSQNAHTLVLDTGELEADGIFLLRDSIAPQTLVPGLETRNGFITVDANMQTNLPGLFAAGDCTGKPHQYMRAAGQGQTAALNAVSFLSSVNTK
jgi:thioredoxin reductase (NADPH)